jgi:hypothetical protein
MDPTGGASGLPDARDLDPAITARLSQAVSVLHAATRLPPHEVLGAIISAGLDHYEEIEARLAEQRLRLVIADLPPDSRDAPDLSAYDKLLTHQGDRQQAERS